MRYKFDRMRIRILSLPACPDWRKVRVGIGKETDADELPTEWEMEQIALDKLKLKRQQSLAQRHVELRRLREEMEAKRSEMQNFNDVTPFDFLLPNGNINEEMLSPSPVFKRTFRTSQSLSLQNLVNFGEMSPNERVFSGRKQINLSHEDMVKSQRLKKLKEIQNELDEFKTIHFHKDTVSDNENSSHGTQLYELTKQGEFRKSNLSLVSLDIIASAKDVPEIAHRIQKMRENDLRKMRRENLLLEYKLKEHKRLRE